ncbi:MAG TPA: BON domain-containing protein [Gammaproteobacteria bacterium]|nr:BON domain-containing protein [Gammaproteobacteria bacterium]
MNRYISDKVSTHTRYLLLGAGLVVALGGVVALAIAAEATPAPAPAAHSDSTGAAISDTDITAKVKYKLSGVKSLKGSDVDVTTTNGVVTLTGTATGSRAEKAAESLAKSVKGVKSVDDELTKPNDSKRSARAKAAVSDSWITTKVKSSLLADSVSKGFDVKVVTTHGVVVLSGKLANQDAIEHVKDVAEKVEGVKSVDTAGLSAAAG